MVATTQQRANFLVDANNRPIGIKMLDGKEYYFSSTLEGEGYLPLAGARNTTKDDDGLILVYAGAGAITLTIPTNMPPRFGFTVLQTGAGQVTIAAGAGVTVTNVSSYTKTSGAGAMFGAQKTGAESYTLLGQGVA